MTGKYFFRTAFSFLITICVLLTINQRNLAFQAEEHEATVRLVLVDVVATDKEGNFVPDLKVEDFEVFEDGKRIPINSFELIFFEKEDILEQKKQILKSGQRFSRKKRFIVIFDSINTIKRIIDRGKQEILENLIYLVKRGREIMVFELSETEGMKILQPFTSEEKLIANAIEMASGSIWVEKSSDALSVPGILAQSDSSLERIGLDGFDLGKFQKTQEHMYEFQSRSRFAKSINSFLSVMNVIKDYPGRKSVLLISGGFPALSFERIYAGEGIESTIPMAQVSASKILDPFKVLQKTKSRDGDQILTDLIRFANSHNITFYTMDPDNYLRYVLPDIAYDNFPRQMHSLDSVAVDNIAEIKKHEQSNLKYISKDTGGTYLLGEKKFENFQKAVSRDLGNYYELSYSPKKKKADGKYHKIDVKIKRPGIDISFRKGYFDYTDDQKESLLFASAAYNPSMFKEIPFEAKANAFVKGKDKYILWFNVALPMKKIITENYDWGHSKILKLGIWIDETGGDSSLKSEMAIPIVLTPNLLERLRRVQFFGFNCGSDEVKLKNDKYRLIFALYDKAESKIGTVEQDLVIPDISGSFQPQVLTAVFGNLIQSSGRGNFKLDQKDGTLQVKGHKLYPMGSNMFRPRKDIALFLQVYAQNKNIQLEPEFFIKQAGDEKRALPFQVVAQTWDKNAKIWNCVYTLDFQKITKGDYSFGIRFSNPQKKIESQKNIPLKII
jgi:VWFA-related protein